MNRQTVIIVLAPGIIECWGNLKKACEVHNWKYNTVSKMKLPFDKDGVSVFRVPFGGKLLLQT
jgi:hypothetical protein